MNDTSAITFAPAPVPARKRNMLVGAGFATGASVVYFGALFGIYFSERADFNNLNPGSSWIPSTADLQLTAPSMIVWTLLLSVITMQWAVNAAACEDRRHLLMAAVVTGVFGIATINQMAFIFIQMGLEADGGSLAAPLIYAICGSFIAMVAAALIFLVLVTLRSLDGQGMRRVADGMSAAAIYWYAMVFVYVVIWLGIFVAK